MTWQVPTYGRDLIPGLARQIPYLNWERNKKLKLQSANKYPQHQGPPESLSPIPQIHHKIPLKVIIKTSANLIHWLHLKDHRITVNHAVPEYSPKLFFLLRRVARVDHETKRYKRSPNDQTTTLFYFNNNSISNHCFKRFSFLSDFLFSQTHPLKRFKIFLIFAGFSSFSHLFFYYICLLFVRLILRLTV